MPSPSAPTSWGFATRWKIVTRFRDEMEPHPSESPKLVGTMSFVLGEPPEPHDLTILRLPLHDRSTLSDLTEHSNQQQPQDAHSAQTQTEISEHEERLSDNNDATNQVPSQSLTILRLNGGALVFACKMCDRRFPAKDFLEVHQRTHTTTGENPHVCSLCGQEFPRRNTLNIHMKRTHAGKKPHVCENCGKEFVHESSLKRHMLSHTGEKPHVCSDCGEKFSRKSNLKRHMLTHTGEKPHACSDCDEAFSLKANLERHMQTHTGEEAA